MKKLLTTLSILLIATSSYAQTYTVERVIDGDTLKLTNGERVRLIGIDTPESKPNDKAKRDSKRTGQDLETINKMGQKAMEFVKFWVKPSQEVRLEFDVQERDKYGRLLVYVYLKPMEWEKTPNWLYLGSKGGLFLNASIISAGYATPMTIPPNVKYADLFQELYEEAREEGRGLWKQNQIESKIIDAKKVRLIGLDALLNHDSATGIRKFPKTVEDEYLKIIARKDVSWSVYYAPPHSAGAYEVWFVEIDNEGTVVGGNHKRE